MSRSVARRTVVSVVCSRSFSRYTSARGCTSQSRPKNAGKKLEGATHVETSKDLPIRRIRQKDLLKNQDGEQEFAGAGRELVDLTVFHRAQIIVSNDALEDDIKSIENGDPVREICPWPAPLGNDGREERWKLVVVASDHSQNKTRDARVGRRLLEGSFYMHDWR